MKVTVTNVPNDRTSKKHERFIELDLLRSCAILFMIFLHILWDLDYFGIYALNQTIYTTQGFVPTLFFILIGMCLAITYERDLQKKSKETYRRLFIRGMWIFSLGMLLTLFSVIVMPDRPIFFGVLHCIGLSIMISIPLLKYRVKNIIFGMIFIILGVAMGAYAFEEATLVHLIIGLHPIDVGHYTIDYFPLFPWLGVCLFGIGIGNMLYKGNIRRFNFPNLAKYKSVEIFSWLGKHSLAIYLAHQPLIAGVLIIVRMI